MEETVSASILVGLCLIQRENPVFLCDPTPCFAIPGDSLPYVLRETYRSRNCTAQHPYFPAYGVRSPGIFQLLIIPKLRAGGEKKASRLLVRFTVAGQQQIASACAFCWVFQHLRCFKAPLKLDFTILPTLRVPKGRLLLLNSFR